MSKTFESWSQLNYKWDCDLWLNSFEKSCLVLEKHIKWLWHPAKRPVCLGAKIWNLSRSKQKQLKICIAFKWKKRNTDLIVCDHFWTKIKIKLKMIMSTIQFKIFLFFALFFSKLASKILFFWIFWLLSCNFFFIFSCSPCSQAN
jgi:hypothetical protein